jgi:hypothetical protein
MPAYLVYGEHFLPSPTMEMMKLPDPLWEVRTSAIPSTKLNGPTTLSPRPWKSNSAGVGGGIDVYVGVSGGIGVGVSTGVGVTSGVGVDEEQANNVIARIINIQETIDWAIGDIPLCSLSIVSGV